MAEQAPSASFSTEVSDEADNGQDCPRANAIVARQEPENIISALPPRAQEITKKVHNQVFADITFPRPHSSFSAKFKRYFRRDRLSQTYERQFTRVIRISVIDERGQSRLVEGTAMIDYWNQYGNLVSRSFGEKLFGNLGSAAPYPIVDSLGGVANSIKNFTASWQCLEERSLVKALFKFQPKMESSNFDIMEFDHSYQIILSYHDIVRLDLLNLGGKLPFAAPLFPHFRSKAMPVNDCTAAAEEAAAAWKQREAERQRQRDKEYDERRKQHAYNKAIAYATDYENKQVAIEGPDADRSAYQRVFESHYKVAYEWYTQTIPRP